MQLTKCQHLQLEVGELNMKIDCYSKRPPWQLFCETLLSLNNILIYKSFQYYICASSVKIFLLVQKTGQTMCRFSLNIFISSEDRTDKAIL